MSSMQNFLASDIRLFRDMKSSAALTCSARNVHAQVGDRVGIPWLGHTCGICRFCKEGMENLCDRPLFTGYTRDGGFATHAIADARYVFPLGEGDDDIAIAPLLCAGLIGWRSLVMAGNAERLGIYGFGAAGHIVAQIARWQGRVVFGSHAQATPLPRILPGSWVRFGPAVGPVAGCPARRRHHLCPRRRIGPRCAPRGAQGRQCGLRRNPHE